MVRLLGGISELAVHPVPHTRSHGPSQILCRPNPFCMYCRYKIERTTAYLAPVLYLLPNDSLPNKADRWERAALILGREAVESLGEFTRGKVLRLSRDQLEVVSEAVTGDEPEAEPFPVEPCLESLCPNPPSAHAIAVMRRYKPGEDVPLTGVYKVSHWDNHHHHTKLICLSGERFPPCNVCGERVQFRLDRPHHSSAEHWLFSTSGQQEEEYEE